jgi:acyl-coenzyme A thioesterase PaaI-like protein
MSEDEREIEISGLDETPQRAGTKNEVDDSMQRDEPSAGCKKQPNSRYCFVCGVANPNGLNLKFYDRAPGEVTAETVVPEHFQGYPGIVHGGVVAAMLDEVCGRVHMGGEPPRFMFTARMEVQYRQNVPVGKPILIVGRAGRSRGRTAEASGAIFGPAGELLAEATALLVNVPEQMIESTNLSQLGWKVYPDEEGRKP